MANQPPQTRLSDDQIDRLVLAIKNLQGSNVVAEVICRSLEKATDLEAQRKILVTAFAQTFELLTVMNMAVESKVVPAEFEAKLNEIRARKNGNTPHQ